MYNAPMSAEYSRVREGLREFEGFLVGKKIGFDIDGVDILSPQSALDELYRRYGVRKTLNDLVRAFEMNNWLKEFEGEKAPRVAWEIWHSREVLENSKSVSGAVSLSRHLHEIGIDPPRITSRPAFTRQWTLDFYKKWMPWVPLENIFMQADGGNEISHNHKVDSIKLMGIEIFFEDNPDHAKEIVEKTQALVVMVPWRWNIDLTPFHPNIVRPWAPNHVGYNMRRGNVYTAYNALARHFKFI